MRTCAFCGHAGSKPSREHVFPEWLSRIGAEYGNYVMDYGNGKVISTPLIEVVTKRVCLECNTGWMARVEDTAVKVMEPLLRASTSVISETDRWVIARWFTKTVLTASLVVVPRSEPAWIPLKSHHDFYVRPEPTNNQLLFLSGYQGPLLPIQFTMTVPNDTTGLRVMFHFHRVVLMAVYVEIGTPHQMAVPRGFKDAAHIIWPPHRGFLWMDDPTLPLPWPPAMLLGDSAVALAIQMFAKEPER
jgi:hypothetical protein